MRLNINRILASLALIMLACIFTMCKEYDEADRVEIKYAFQENPVSIKMLDAFGHNIIYGDRLKVYSINGDGQDSSLNYMVKNHGEDLDDMIAMCYSSTNSYLKEFFNNQINS